MVMYSVELRFHPQSVRSYLKNPPLIRDGTYTSILQRFCIDSDFSKYLLNESCKNIVKVGTYIKVRVF